MSKKVVAVIGGTGGLGAACAKDLAKDHIVVVGGRNKAKGDEVVQAIQSVGGEALFLPIDMASIESIKKYHADIKSTYGRLDAAVNSAGITGPFELLVNFPEQDIMNVLTANLTGVIFSLQEQIRLMRSNPSGSGGRIVNMASIYSSSGCPYGSIYTATKHALVGLTKSLALEHSNPRDNILINCIAPGIILTDMTAVLDDPEVLPEGAFKEIVRGIKPQYPQGRYGELEDVTRGVRFLLESGWMTGTLVQVDGGFGAK